MREERKWEMIHLGDITKINGAAAPIVDCVIGGSPCQDLSVAGKRAGLAGETVWLTASKSTLLGETNDTKTFCKTADGRGIQPELCEFYRPTLGKQEFFV